MKPRFVISGIILLGVILFGVWLWKLGAPPVSAASTVRLEVVRGQVEMRTSASGTWMMVQEGQAIEQGSSLRTGPTGSVTLTVTGVSQTRLSTSTEITIDALALSAGQTQTSLHLVAGHTWSRIVRLLELDSAYTVKTDDVVATVRGTTFETWRLAKETRLAVYGGTVKTGERLISAGNGVRATKTKLTEVKAASISSDAAWMEKNQEADKLFLQEAQGKVKFDLTDVPMGVYKVFGTAAERFRVAFTPEQEQASLKAKYLDRRLALAKVWEDLGEKDAAARDLVRVKEGIEDLKQLNPEVRPPEINQLFINANLLYQGAASSSIPFLREDIERLKVDRAAPVFIQPIKQDVLKQGSGMVAPTSSSTQKADGMLPPPPVSTEGQRLPSSNTVIVPPVPGLTPRVLRFFPETPIQIRLGQRVPLSVVVEYTDGTKRMVNLTTAFLSSDPAIAVVQDTFVDGRAPGAARVTATYRENGVTVMASLSVTVER